MTILLHCRAVFENFRPFYQTEINLQRCTKTVESAASVSGVNTGNSGRQLRESAEDAARTQGLFLRQNQDCLSYTAFLITLFGFNAFPQNGLTMKRMLPSLPLFFLLLFIIVVSSCSDNEVETIEHFYNPVWSPDGMTVVAAYVNGNYIHDSQLIGPGSPALPGTQLAIMDVNTRSLRTIDLSPLRTQHAFFEFDRSASVLLFAQQGRLSLVDLSGTVRSTYTVRGDAEYMAARFVENNANIALCAEGSTQLVVRRLIFDPSTWQVIDDSLLVSAAAPAPVIALTPIGRDAFAVRFNNGVIRYYGYDGSLLQSFTTAPYTSINEWHQRMVLFQNSSGTSLLYVMEQKALSTLNLVTGAKTVLVTGEVIDMDVTDKRNSLVYETTTGDTWLSSVSGLPLSRIAPQNIMPRFSVGGDGIVAVERINARTDSLHILRFF